MSPSAGTPSSIAPSSSCLCPLRPETEPTGSVSSFVGQARPDCFEGVSTLCLRSKKRPLTIENTHEPYPSSGGGSRRGNRLSHWDCSDRAARASVHCDSDRSGHFVRGIRLGAALAEIGQSDSAAKAQGTFIGRPTDHPSRSPPQCWLSLSPVPSDIPTAASLTRSHSTSGTAKSWPGPFAPLIGRTSRERRLRVELSSNRERSSDSESCRGSSATSAGRGLAPGC
jgi:hypothetical protein